jgi:hypothetical protein
VDERVRDLVFRRAIPLCSVLFVCRLTECTPILGRSRKW